MIRFRSFFDGEIKVLGAVIEILKIQRELSHRYQTYSDEYCRLTTVGSIKGDEEITSLVDLKGKSRDYYLFVLALYIYGMRVKRNLKKSF